MNKRIKKKQKTRAIEEDKKLMKKYPFLRPQVHWYSGKSLSKQERKQCSSWANDIPIGWMKRFGVQMFEDMKMELIRCGYLHKYTIVQVKEKYGELCIYSCSVPKDCNVDRIIDNYSVISRTVCMSCGKMDCKSTRRGWIYPMCEDCHDKTSNQAQYNKVFFDDLLVDGRTPESYEYTRYTTNGKEIHKVDISDIVNKIRK